MISAKWDKYFLDLCIVIGSISKDPSTKVGAVIVGQDKEIRSTGFNGFPRGILDSHERLNDKEMKLSIIVHAELNAILNAARIGISTRDCTLYFVACKDDGVIWGGCPCSRCTVEIIQAGITTVVSPAELPPTRWTDDMKFASELMKEAGMLVRTIV